MVLILMKYTVNMAVSLHARAFPGLGAIWRSVNFGETWYYILNIIRIDSKGF
jgi:hypothetical protein